MQVNFGKYISHDSLIHNIDGRIKFVAFLLILISIFLKNNFIPYFSLLFFLLLIFLLAKLPWKSFWEICQTVFFMFCFLFVFNLININNNDQAVASNNRIWQWEFLLLSWNGLFLTFYYSLRVFLVILLTVLLITTTRPKVLTQAIEALLTPLRWLRFPTHIFSTIISLTLRLIPTLIEEANNIMEAQASRGLDFKSSSLRIKFKILISILIPLIISIFKRADEMAVAMESRNYDPYKKQRSSYHFFALRWSDLMILAFVLTFFFSLVAFLYFNNNHFLEWFPNKWLVYKL